MLKKVRSEIECRSKALTCDRPSPHMTIRTLAAAAAMSAKTMGHQKAAAPNKVPQSLHQRKTMATSRLSPRKPNSSFVQCSAGCLRRRKLCNWDPKRALRPWFSFIDITSPATLLASYPRRRKAQRMVVTKMAAAVHLYPRNGGSIWELW